MAKAKKPPAHLTYGHGPQIAPGQSLQGRTAKHVPPGTPLNATTWAEYGAWVAVVSSNVAGINYDKDEEVLYVEFQAQSGPAPAYEYRDVPLTVAMDMYNASSLGQFVRQRLKLFQHRRITARIRRPVIVTPEAANTSRPGAPPSKW